MTSDAGRSRAVLFGVHDFRELPRLDGVRHNIPALLELLTSDAVGGLAEQDCGVVPHDGTQQQMLDALHDATEAATDLLLVYYAGHGHFGGRDRSFLLATRESSGQRPYHSVKYSDIRDLVSGCAAQRKVVIIDCCFSGRALSMSDEQTPTQLDTEITGACVLTSAAETERSLCLPDGSIFSLELIKLLSEGLSGELTAGRRGEHLPHLTMVDVFNTLHTRLLGRTVDGLRVPQPRMSTRDQGHQIVLARNRAYTGPPAHLAESGAPSPAEEHAWVAATRDHPLWNYVTDERGLPLLRETATALVARAAVATAQDGMALNDDPWHSPSFPDRVAEWTDSLLLDSSLRPEELALTAAEVFLLVTHPYLHATFWMQNAHRYSSFAPTQLAEAPSTAPARRSYEVFLRNHPRLVRRALRNDSHEAARAIGWWLFHRWLVLEPRLYDPAAAETLLDRLAVPLGDRSPRERRLVEDVLDPPLMSQLLRAPQLPGRPEGAGAMPRSVGMAETAQRVRAHQLAELLRMAHLFAIDPITLPEVLVDHVGIGYAVDLGGLHSTLDRFRWEANGRARVLRATCDHLAVDLGLRQHAAAIDVLLARIDISSGEGERPPLLRNLPLHATAEQVTPAADAGGRRAYESTELRFRLADDRIQELLMGEQLYGDPALAIRELYQNALDACRYREARTRYLSATRGRRMPYEGTIAFSQGVDEEGPYLECRDNGIGMGEVELRDVFSHAGMSFADLPEYIEEKARWDEYGISMHPNSQFGVGVLSYFMLADDITVTTCRLTPDGLPGEHLRIDIAGPGSLFRIQRLERSPDAYTSVRLRLRSADVSSCVDVLRRILWISPYAVTAGDDRGETQSWAANVLGDRAPLGTSDPHKPDAVRAEDTVAVATSTPAVWWCSTGGAVLADGLWAGQRRFGAVVNLSGRHTPRLTVDRRRIIDVDTAEVERLMRQEIPRLLAAGDTVFRHDWLAHVLEESPGLADEIFAEAVRSGFTPWRIAGREVDITKCGYHPLDEPPAAELMLGAWASSTDTAAIEPFRIGALVDAGFYPGFVTTKPSTVVLPVPSDIYVLRPRWNAGSIGSYGFPVSWHQFRVSIGLIAEAAATTGWSFGEITARLERLGFSPPTTSVTQLEPEDLLIISERLTGDSPWLYPGEPVHPAHVIDAMKETGRTSEHIIRRLTELGYRVATDPMPRPGDQDQLILSSDLDGRQPWLALGTQVSNAHLVLAAGKTGWAVEEVAARLREFGFSTPIAPTSRLEPDDLRILSRNTSGRAPWINPRTTVHPAHIVLAATMTGHTVDHVVSRLTELGHHVGTLPVPPLEPGDLRLLSRNCTEQPPWLASGESVHPAQLVRAASATGRTIDYVSSRLASYGLRPSARAPQGEPDDGRLISRDLDGEVPWLEYDQPVGPGHVLRAAKATSRSPQAVIARLEELGYTLHDGIALSTDADPVGP
ncbi:caspase family protein [Streptomyces sp. SP2-10]|uniref:caspase, EACC1-associated type n=1 Tax=Streptomyces sp. SP2-10 TaxID=2873385 RepID=UPI001CA74106|nr:caspase family protein [Streptomyces sp. SP2-10]MBY8840666.1 caspase family protein [Streptomyces sp. SP2-10]